MLPVGAWMIGISMPRRVQSDDMKVTGDQRWNAAHAMPK